MFSALTIQLDKSGYKQTHRRVDEGIQAMRRESPCWRKP
ncbi:TPA: hypothetical protein SG618_002800 [Klebsiella pneumoniae]|nr:hypothetical protein [Klebsiella pneumoniae]HDU3917213.1 hypothetical protein [Klebsiella pneumoniae subsp. pneumoniae]MEA4547661.1 hypothetical protein [Klebsiella pneumoniae]HBQ4003122.1 hypothetical protein [Klebsiella pneumoniae]HBT4747278.1 hypothetical protein [Klebsiella pneumoniae]HBW3163747.1 hypothetical protein [Klebsiella pneumoniae]